MKRSPITFDIVRIEYLISTHNNQFICGRVLKSVKDIFRLPFPSSYLLMYSSENCENLEKLEIFNFGSVAGKLFKLKKIIQDENEEIVYIVTMNVSSSQFCTLLTFNYFLHDV